MSATAAAPSIEIALKHHQEGHPVEAEAAYRAVLEGDPDEPNIPALLGMLLLRANRVAEALPLLSRAAALHPDDPETHLAYANAMLSAGNPADAVAHYRKLLERWPHKAGAWSNLSEALRAQGENESALAAADKAVAILPGLANAHLGRGNALLALGRASEAEAAYACALAQDPTLAAAEASHGAALVILGRTGDAAAAAERALAIEPGLAEAHFVLGCARRAEGRRDAAIAAFEDALRLDSRHARAWLNLGNALVDADRLEEARTAYTMAIEIDSGFAEAHSSLGCLFSQQGRIDDALDAFDRAIALRPDYAEAHWNQGFALLLAGDFTRGWEKYEWRKRHDRFAKTFPDLGGPAWEGEALAGSRLLVYAEQGLGDTLQFVRYAPLLAARGAEVILACDPKLIPLLDSAPGLARIVSKNAPLPAYDSWVDQMSLPRMFGTNLDSIPAPTAYLKPDPARVAAWRRSLPTGRKIGLVWAGNPSHSNDARRSLPIDLIRPLLTVPDAIFVSLQIGPKAHEAAALGSAILDITARLTDFAESAAAVANLDLVVAVDTAVAHLAGAIGTPIWVLVPHAPDWRWLFDREDTPWYASMRLFRQPAPGDWAAVIARVRATLAAA